MSFEFATAARILFGQGVSSQVAHAAAAMGRRALVVTGATPERAAPLVRPLEAAGIPLLAVPGGRRAHRGSDPRRRRVARAGRCDVVISMGGGSAIDAGKALAAMLANPGDPLDYLEVIGRGDRWRIPRPRPSPSPPPPERGRKSRATPCWPRPNIASKPACAALICCRDWRWWIPS